MWSLYFFFASMLSTLMTHAAVRLCGGWCCQRYVRSGRIYLCSFGYSSLHVWYAAVSVWNSYVSLWSKVKRVACRNLSSSILFIHNSQTGCFPPYILKPSLRVLAGFPWKARWKSGTVLNEVKLWERAVHKRQNERLHNKVHQAEYSTFSSSSPKIWTSS